MKKLFAILMSAMLFVSLAACALAADDQVHNGTLPYTSEQDVKITIKGLHDGGEDDGTKLPSEYHIRVKWNKLDGVYAATKTDGGESGFKNFTWDCVKLDYVLGTVTSGSGADIRQGNWVSIPAVSFEVTNASTPDLSIKATPSLKGANAWAQYLKADTIEAQNTAIGSQTIPPVLKANLGTGVNSYEENKGAASHNVYAYAYTFNWDYDALNRAALAAYKAGTGDVELTNTFAVRVEAAGATEVVPPADKN